MVMGEVGFASVRKVNTRCGQGRPQTTLLPKSKVMICDENMARHGCRRDLGSRNPRIARKGSWAAVSLRPVARTAALPTVLAFAPCAAPALLGEADALHAVSLTTGSVVACA